MISFLIRNVLFIITLNIDDGLPPLVRRTDDEDSSDDEDECA